MHDIIALAASYLFVFSVLGAASLLLAFGKISPFVTRKIVHIGVSIWWILAMFFFTSPGSAIIGPVSFIIINYISYRKHIFAAMEHEIPRKNLGTIYFPVSLAIMVLLTFQGPMPKSAGAAAILVLGYGDGLAAVVGNARAEKSWSIPFIPQRKTIAGSVTMFIVSFTVLLIIRVLLAGGFTLPDLLPILLITAAVTVVEALTPFGLDNITIPLVCGFLFWRLM